MDYRSLRTIMALCVVAQATLAGCSAKGPGTQVPPIPPSQAHLYVFNATPNGGSIAGFPISAAGNVAPATSISGSVTGLDGPLFGTVGAAGTSYAPNVNANSVTTYVSGANGNVGSASDLAGPATGLGQPAGVAVASSGEYYVCNAEAGSPYASITEYAAGSTGNTAPLATIRGTSTLLNSPVAVALDASGYIYVSNTASTSGGLIAVFAPNSKGNIPPARIIAGGATGLNEPAGIAFDASGYLYVSNHAGNSVTVYAAGASGNVAPLHTIAGAKTGLNGPTGITIDSNGYVYVANNNAPSITVYAAGATQNVVPIRTIAGAKTGLNRPYGVALY